MASPSPDVALALQTGPNVNFKAIDSHYPWGGPADRQLQCRLLSLNDDCLNIIYEYVFSHQHNRYEECQECNLPSPTIVGYMRYASGIIGYMRRVSDIPHDIKHQRTTTWASKHGLPQMSYGYENRDDEKWVATKFEIFAPSHDFVAYGTDVRASRQAYADYVHGSDRWCSTNLLFTCRLVYDNARSFHNKLRQVWIGAPHIPTSIEIQLYSLTQGLKFHRGTYCPEAVTAIPRLRLDLNCTKSIEIDNDADVDRRTNRMCLSFYRGIQRYLRDDPHRFEIHELAITITTAETGWGYTTGTLGSYLGLFAAVRELRGVKACTVNVRRHRCDLPNRFEADILEQSISAFKLMITNLALNHNHLPPMSQQSMSHLLQGIYAASTNLTSQNAFFRLPFQLDHTTHQYIIAALEEDVRLKHVPITDFAEYQGWINHQQRGPFLSLDAVTAKEDATAIAHRLPPLLVPVIDVDSLVRGWLGSLSLFPCVDDVA